MKTLKNKKNQAPSTMLRPENILVLAQFFFSLTDVYKIFNKMEDVL